jgi:F1F0 ATPase subunit 2
MSSAFLVSSPALTMAAALAGLAGGLLYFAALRRTVTLLASGESWIGALTWSLGRFGAAVIMLLLLARLGAAPLLAALLGFLAARAIAIRAARRAG